MFILSLKLNILKCELNYWNKNTFGSVHELLSKTSANQDDIQSQIQINGHPDELNDQISLEFDATASARLCKIIN